MGEYSCLGPGVDCYNVAEVIIGDNTTISQRCYLCTADHDIRKANLPLISKKIVIKDQVWIAAEAFIGPGVTVGQGSVVAARCSIVKDVEPWVVMAGNPGAVIKKRTLTAD
jgi:putative colanic acid biosynthesis acetyltransferase WcaF